MNQTLIFNQREIPLGSKTAFKLRVTTDLNGEDISLWIHVARGTKPGPTLTLLSGLHGNEWLGSEIIHRIFDRTDLNLLQGNIIGVPVSNPVAFCSGGRHITDDSDTPDLNRAFPGNWSFISDQLARSINENVLSKTNYLISFHPGSWGTLNASVWFPRDAPDNQVVIKSSEMAKVFAHPYIACIDICTVYPGPQSIMGYASAKLGIPSIVSELGGVGFGKEQEEAWIQRNIVGVNNVMKSLKMLDGGISLPEKYLVWLNRWRVNPTVAGLLYPLKEPNEMITHEVFEGELLGKILSPYSFEEIEELRSPGHGVIFYASTRKPIRPGLWAFGIIKLDNNCSWIPCEQPLF